MTDSPQIESVARATWITRWGVPSLDHPGSRSFVTALFIQSIGNGLFLTFILLYFHQIAGLPLAEVGVALTIASAIGLIVNPIAGHIVDSIGAKQMLIASLAIQAVGYSSFFIADTIPLVIAVVLLTSIGERVFWVAFPTLVSTIAKPSERDRWFAFTTAVRNGGLGLGGLIAALVIWLAGDSGYSLLLVANVGAFAVAGCLIFVRVPTGRMRSSSSAGDGYRLVMRDRPAMTVVSANVAFAYCALMVYFALPVYIVETLGLPAWVVGFLFALNTVQLALGQTLAIRMVDCWRRTRVLAAAGLIWVVTSILFAAALEAPRWALLPYITIVLVLYTMGEMIHAPTSTSLVAALAPDALRGRYLALVSLSWGIAQTIGPALFTGLLDVGAAIPWFVTGLIAAGGAALVITAEPRIPKALLIPAIGRRA